MPRRKSSRKRPEWTRGALLDWTTGPHWDYDRARPCRYCDGLTQLRDSDKKPAHKVCAEAALDQQAEDAAAAYYQQEDRR
ncbi:hypothetical protein [Streptomyces sp. NBC_00443]|uniref:hypothetical protein n=1 Tax=Streptomyces sp. NBC_00443 TaxID=2975743 RepID=UPI002E23848E